MRNYTTRCFFPLCSHQQGCVEKMVYSLTSHFLYFRFVIQLLILLNSDWSRSCTTIVHSKVTITSENSRLPIASEVGKWKIGRPEVSVAGFSSNVRKVLDVNSRPDVSVRSTKTGNNRNFPKI